MTNTMKDLLNWISDLLWPLACLGCRKAGIRLCTECLSGMHGGSEAPCRAMPPLDRLFAAGTMRSPLLGRAIWHLKYRNAPDLAEPLGDWLAISASSAGLLTAHDTIVVPVPLHPARLRERGYNQAELLAQRVALLAPLPCLPGALVRIRRTASQVESSRAQRIENMSGAFACTDPALVRGRSVVLVDDVCTTGATLAGCAAALKDAGAGRVTAIVLAR